MIYEFACESCGEVEEFVIPLDLLETARERALCVDCNSPAVLVMSGGRKPIVRSPFPKGYHEHISADGAVVRDKHEARDIAAQNGFTSKLVENWDR
jgi:hypothetical protein